MKLIHTLLFAGAFLTVSLACGLVTSGTVGTPAPTAEGTAEDLVVIEGPVDKIENNIITIANTTIEVNINDPLLTLIQVGDTIRVEGTPVVQNNIVIIQVVNILNLEKNVIIINNGTDPLPDGCKITPKGHIKCSKKKP